MKKLPLDFLQEKARLMTREALEHCVIPEDMSINDLFLEIKFDNDERTFELYQSAGKSQEDDRLISRTQLNVFTGNGTVETFLPKVKQ